MVPPPELIRTLDDDVRVSLQSVHDSYFHQLVVYGIAVAVGIIFELPEVIKVIREAFTNWRSTKHLEQAIAVLGVIGWLMVASGVAGETVCEALVFSADTLIQTFDSGLLTDAQQRTAFALEDAESAKALASGYQAQIADSNTRVKVAEATVATAKADVADAVAKVATADARIAEADARAQEARSIAEAEKLEREKLEVLVAPRRLSVEQQRQLSTVLRKYARKTVRVSTYGLDGEGAAIGTQIIAVLNTVGILVIDERASFLRSSTRAARLHSNKNDSGSSPRDSAFLDTPFVVVPRSVRNQTCTLIAQIGTGMPP